MFFGNIYSDQGMRPDPMKVQAIQDIKVPENMQQLQSFLGLITYLSPYFPNLSKHTTPLRKLLQKESEFQWNFEQQQAFDNIKEMISEVTKLSFFDPHKDTIIQVDASQEALGAALLQEGNVIAFASKSLSDTEKRYANIERELLACVFGAERFHNFVYGTPFIIESDHKPLEMITMKNLTAAPPRLQRMLLRLQSYDYSIKYRPGKEMTLADSLSRIPNNASSDEINLDLKVCFIQFANSRLQEIRMETKNDSTLRRLMTHIVNGFPTSIQELHQEVRPYWSFGDELSIEDGILLKGSRVVIPSSLQESYLDKIHEGHQGITRCTQHAKSSIYWPGINKDIENKVKMCSTCQEHGNSQSKEPLMSVIEEIPNVVWHTLGTDLFYMDHQEYLIIADYKSKFPIVEKLNGNSSCKYVANITEKIFSIFGVPNSIISDNGPQFIGKAYQNLMKKHGINQITISPHHPQSHGFIERMIQTVKNLLTKSNHDPHGALLQYRCTPLGPSGPSPAEMMFGRQIQNDLPVYVRRYISDNTNDREESKITHDGSASLSPLAMGQHILYQDVAKKTWSPGVIVGIGPEPRSYTIRCNNSMRMLRRNRILLKPSPQGKNRYNPQNDYYYPSSSTQSADQANDFSPPPSPSPSAPEIGNPLEIPEEEKDTSVVRTRYGRVINPPKRLITEM